jgi:hypothetical protein
MPAQTLAKRTHLLNRNGRYTARLSVPAALRPIIMKRELLESLGPDRADALRKLPGAIGRMQDVLNAARQELDAGRKPSSPPPTPGRILSLRNLAKAHFDAELAKHDVERRADLSPFAESLRHGAETVLPFYAEKLRTVVRGLASNDEADALIGWAIDDFRQRGNTGVEFGTPEWRELAQGLAAIHIETMKLKVAHDSGDFSPQPQHPLLVKKQATPDDPLKVRIIGPDSERTLGDLVDGI